MRVEAAVDKEALPALRPHTRRAAWWIDDRSTLRFVLDQGASNRAIPFYATPEIPGIWTPA